MSHSVFFLSQSHLCAEAVSDVLGVDVLAELVHDLERRLFLGVYLPLEETNICCFTWPETPGKCVASKKQIRRSGVYTIEGGDFHPFQRFETAGHIVIMSTFNRSRSPGLD